MQDDIGRQIEYLRISITERCNLACRYCKPLHGAEARVLTDAQIGQIAKAGGMLGMRKIRLTGGEPLVRENVAHLVALLRETHGIEQVAITTNGVLLHQQLPALLAAGLSRVNISLDATSPALYAKITGRDCVLAVQKGIDAALTANLPVRINCVPLQSSYIQQIAELAALADAYAVDVRFIELMPMGKAAEIQGVPNTEILRVLSQKYGAFTTVEKHSADGPAQYYRFAGQKGRIGLISPLSHSFCSECNRVRVSATGFLRTCLACAHGADLRPALVSGIGLQDTMQAAILAKPICHHFGDAPCTDLASMAQIGG